MTNFFQKLTKNWNRKHFVLVLAVVFVWVLIPATFLPFGAPSASADQWWEYLPPVMIGKAVGGAVGGAAGDAAMWLLAQLALMIFKIAGLWMASMAFLLDFALEKTLDSNLINGLAIIDIGWTLCRDVANMFFIFILLWIAIQTILGLAGHSTKQLLRNIILVALLINFSLFFTKVIIDVTNVFAGVFYYKIETPVGGKIVNGPSQALMDGLKLQSIVRIEKNDVNPANELNLSSGDEAKIYLGGALLMFVTGYVFLAGAALMMIRSIVLIFCMIFAPLAFLGYILPKMSSVTSKWWSTLIDNALVAPVFTFVIYLDVLMIRNGDLIKFTGSENASYGQALGGNLDNFSIFYNFLIMIGIMLGTLAVSKAVAGGTAGMAISWAKKGSGAATGAGLFVAGAGLRQTAGRVGAMTAESKTLKELARSSSATTRFLGNLGLATGEKMKKSTYDVRNTAAGRAGLGAAKIDAGAGSKRSFATTGAQLGTGGKYFTTAAIRDFRGTENEAEYIKIANERYKGDPVARKNYLIDKLGAQYDTERHKDLKSGVERDLAKKKAKDSIDEQAQKQSDIDKSVKEGRMTKEKAEIEGAAIAAAVGKALKGLTITERAEMAEKYKDNSAYLSNIGKGELAAIHKMELDGGKYKAPVMQTITEKIMSMPKDEKIELQQYLMSDETQEKLFNVDYSQLNTERYQKIKALVLKKEAAEAEAYKENRRREMEAERKAKEDEERAKESTAEEQAQRQR